MGGEVDWEGKAENAALGILGDGVGLGDHRLGGFIIFDMIDPLSHEIFKDLEPPELYKGV